MSVGVIVLLLVELALIGGAAWFWLSSRRERAHEAMLTTLVEHLPAPRRLDVARLADDAPPGLAGRIASLFDGVEARWLLGGAALVLGTAAIVGARGGAEQGFVALVLGAGLGALALMERRRRQRRAILLQLPMFIDLVLRSLAAGKAVEFALRHSTWETQAPLRPILDEVVRAVDAGGGLAQAMHRAAARFDIREFALFALAIHISYNYGSNPKPLLENVADLVRRNEQMRRELAAMTGETRFSAWVLGLLPVAVVGFLHFGNPAYIGNMLDDPTGRWMFGAAVALQLGGGFVLWRMMRSLD